MTELKPGQKVSLIATVETVGPSGVTVRIGNRAWSQGVQHDEISTTPPMSEEDAELLKAVMEVIANFEKGQELPNRLAEAVNVKRKAQRLETAQKALTAAIGEEIHQEIHEIESAAILVNLEAAGFEVVKRS